MQNEINILSDLVDLALEGGIMKNQNMAGQVLHSIGVIRTQVPELIKENKELKELLAESNKTEKPGPSMTKQDPKELPKHKGT